MQACAHAYEHDAAHGAEPFERRTYGYDCVNVVLTEAPDGKFLVSFTERETPSAEETERRYDHTSSPNHLVRREECTTQASER